LYDALEHATPEERTELVLRYIEEHGQPLELPKRDDGVRANLQDVDLSQDRLGHLLDSLGVKEAPWWDRYFKRADLSGANLQGADLSEANLQGAYLSGAKLQGAELWSANLQGAELVFANLQGADLWRANLQGADLSEANLQFAKLLGANLQGADLVFANLQGADLSEANLQGADLSGAKLQDTTLYYAHLENSDLSAADNLQFISISGAWLDGTRLGHKQLGTKLGDELEAEKRNPDSAKHAKSYGAAKRAYLALKQNFEGLGDYDAASWAYRKERRMEKWEVFYTTQAAWKEHHWWKMLKGYIEFVSDLLQELISDYGESVWRVAAGIGLILVGFAIGYGLTNSVIRVDGPTQHVTHEWLDLAIFSLGGMTTMDTGDLKPACDWVRLAFGIQILLSIAMTGLLGFVVGNRIRHS
jgi:uncharacterized protein YjbI with pentapeptide repeats